ncbi:nuclear transport factor 2 family protein [Promicromonospora sp. NPDC050249]|uniref:nuclear transport factor 2 family protein n=1 Tax=Promicromonospora sp. NPDC050249 TaxID=3154743 RepID=UPI0034065E1C
MADESELLERMIQQVFNEPDPARRAEVIAELFTEDVVFADGERTVRGRDDLAATVTRLLDEAPGLAFTHTGPFRGTGDLGMRPWALAPAGGEPVARGLDVVLLEENRIGRLWTLLEG